MPDRFGSVPATSYDANGRPNGLAQLSMVHAGDGAVRVGVHVVLDDGIHANLRATLEPRAHNMLQLIRERAEVLGPQGARISQMQIDHRHGWARCTGADGKTDAVALPHPDRVANIPMNLLFRPLVDGQKQQVNFQTLLCGDPARIINTQAILTQNMPRLFQGHRLVEIRYRFDLGPVLSMLARPFLKHVTFWFEPAAPVPWVAHRIPLYAQGPTIMIMRNALRPADLFGRR